MRFILDSNIIFSALIKDSLTRQIILTSPFAFYVPETFIEEFKKHKGLIAKKAKLTSEEIEFLLGILLEKIISVNKRVYQDYLHKTEDLIGKRDKNDVPFLALALSIKNSGIWTDDEDFTEQNVIKVWKTADIINLINHKI